MTTEHANLSAADVTDWVQRYEQAWRTNDAADIASLFTEDGEYHETPYETHWIGRDDIVAGWQNRWDWQQGGWRFEWRLVGIVDGTATVHGTGYYTELGTFDNVWTLALDASGRCSRFDMVNTERDAEDS